MFDRKYVMASVKIFFSEGNKQLLAACNLLNLAKLVGKSLKQRLAKSVVQGVKAPTNTGQK